MLSKEVKEEVKEGGYRRVDKGAVTERVGWR